MPSASSRSVFAPSGAAVDENAGGFKNMADDTMCRQQTVQPEAVTSRLKAADNAYRRVEPASNTGPPRRDQSQQGGRVAAIDPMQMWLLQPWHAGGDEPRCCTEFDSKEDSRINGVNRLHSGSSIALIRAAKVSAQPVAIASGTRFLSCRCQPSSRARSRPSARGSFFKILDRAFGLGIMAV